MPGFSAGRTGNWAAARKKFEEAQRDPKKRIGVALRRAALVLEREVKLGLARGAPGDVPLRPLAEMTILQRRSRSSRPLLDTGALMGAVTSRVDEASGTGFVGVLRAGRGNMARIAEIHEFGTDPYSILVTSEIRRFFLAMFIVSNGRIMPLRASTQFIHHPGIPARPYLRPALEAARPKIASEIKLVLEN
jgi:hypothetical protein